MLAGTGASAVRAGQTAAGTRPRAPPDAKAASRRSVGLGARRFLGGARGAPFPGRGSERAVYVRGALSGMRSTTMPPKLSASSKNRCARPEVGWLMTIVVIGEVTTGLRMPGTWLS
jgi:hypothetical protein